MPIYEFYCQDCHTIYSFFARRVDTETIPKCPKCSRKKLRRVMSRFAISKGRGDSAAEESGGMDGMPDMDDPKMEQAMMAMASEMENVNEDDPKAMAHMMRKLFETTGMQPGDSMMEAMRRMEAGEDPDKIDEEMGDALEAEDPFASGVAMAARKGNLRRLTEAPGVDPEIYDM